MKAEKGFTDREDNKKQLFLNKKQLLDTFLEHGAISKAQYLSMYRRPLNLKTI